MNVKQMQRISLLIKEVEDLKKRIEVLETRRKPKAKQEAQNVIRS